MDSKISSSPTSEKTTVFNLIILDESGSMSHLTKATISGCNETLNVIRHTAKQNPDTIRSLVSIYAFQSDGERPSRYIVKNAGPQDVKNITTDDYEPYGNTPLLDAVGSTLSELKTVAATHENSTAIITIITDGYENSSHIYSPREVAKLIAQVKELGWTVNLIGANIDVDKLADAMNIDNKMSFTHSPEGASHMFTHFNKNVACCVQDYADEDRSLSMNERIHLRKARSKKFFG